MQAAPWSSVREPRCRWQSLLRSHAQPCPPIPTLTVTHRDTAGCEPHACRVLKPCLAWYFQIIFLKAVVPQAFWLYCIFPSLSLTSERIYFWFKIIMSAWTFNSPHGTHPPWSVSAAITQKHTGRGNSALTLQAGSGESFFWRMNGRL